MDAEQTDKLNTIAGELHQVRQQLDRIETNLIGRGSGDAAPVDSQDEFADRVIDRLWRSENRSSLLDFPRPVLREFARQVLEPRTYISEAIDWLNGKAGYGTSKSAAYRFAADIRDAAHLLQEADQAAATPVVPQDDEATDAATLRSILAKLRGQGRQNRLLDLSDELLVGALRRLGDTGLRSRSAVARSWLAQQTGRPVNVNAFAALRAAVHDELRRRRERQKRAGASARAPGPIPR